jgi:hypothetical protein
MGQFKEVSADAIPSLPDRREDENCGASQAGNRQPVSCPFHFRVRTSVFTVRSRRRYRNALKGGSGLNSQTYTENRLPIHRGKPRNALMVDLVRLDMRRRSNSLTQGGHRPSESADDVDSNEIHKNDALERRSPFKRLRMFN